jgi:type II secretory pathway component GspD/PulD (secretin)
MTFTTSGAAAPLPQDKAETPPGVKIAIRVVESTEAQARKHPQIESLLKSGGKVIASPTVLTLDGMAAQIEQSQTIPYALDEGNQAQQPKTATVRTGLSVHVTPHINQDGTVRIDLEADDTELAPAGAPATVKYGIANSRVLTTGTTVLFGTWIQGKKTVSVYVSAEKN